MREVFTHQDFTRVGHFRSVLEEAGIVTFIRNEHTNHAMTGLPSHLFFPTLCVLNDDDYEKAMELLQPLHVPPPWSPDWVCPTCAESNPGNFEFCWSCTMERVPIE